MFFTGRKPCDVAPGSASRVPAGRQVANRKVCDM